MNLYPLLVPAGSDSEVQYNNGGIFGGDSTFKFNDTTKVVSANKITLGTSAGASGIELDGTDPDYLLQSHAKVTTDLATGAYSSIYSSATITSNQTNNTSIFSDWAELYITGDLTLSSANNAAMWGNLEMADAGGSLTLSADTLWLAGVVGTVISPDGLVIGTGRDVAGVLSDSSITAGYTNNGTFSAFAARKSLGKAPWPVAFNVLSGAATIDFQGQGCTLGPNSAVFRPLVDSTTFFQVLDADGGTPVFNVDSTNERVGIACTPTALLTLGSAAAWINRDRANSSIALFGGTGSTDSAYFNITGNSYVGSPGAGSSEFVIRNNAGSFDNRSKFALFSYNGVSAWTTRFLLDGYTGNIGIGVTGFVPTSLTQWYSTAPYLTIQNSTHENIDGGGESRIIGNREDGAGTITSAGQIEICHDGAGVNDQLGRMVFSVNSGAGLAEVLRFDSGLNTLIAGANHLHLRDSAIGIYSQADTFMDLFADGGVRIGDSSAGAPTNYVQVDSGGDMKFVGGAGLQFGSCYGNHIGWSQATAVQNTWYNIADADMTDGNLNGVAHDGNGKLTVTYAGMYLVGYNLTCEASVANNHIEAGIEISGGGSADNAGQSHVETVTANGEYALAGTCILDLAASATIETAIRTTDATTPDLSIQHLNITCVQVGGT